MKTKEERHTDKVINLLRKAIDNNKLNLEKHCTGQNFTWYGHKIIVGPLFCSYGQIGYTIRFDGDDYQYDYELNKIEKE